MAPCRILLGGHPSAGRLPKRRLPLSPALQAILLRVEDCILQAFGVGEWCRPSWPWAEERQWVVSLYGQQPSSLAWPSGGTRQYLCWLQQLSQPICPFPSKQLDSLYEKGHMTGLNQVETGEHESGGRAGVERATFSRKPYSSLLAVFSLCA